MEIMNSKLKKYITLSFVVVIAGVLDFATATLFQTVLHVPLFLDMTFAMAVLFAYATWLILPCLSSVIILPALVIHLCSVSVLTLWLLWLQLCTCFWILTSCTDLKVMQTRDTNGYGQWAFLQQSFGFMLSSSSFLPN